MTSLFYGFGAFVGSISGPSTCAFWPEDPVAITKWDPALLVPVDLAKTPQAFRNGEITLDEITVDDHTTNSVAGLTQIGPQWPDGDTIGAVWLAKSYYESLGTNRAPRVPVGMQCFTYELTSAITWSGAVSQRRFYGVHASILDVQGVLSLVQIWNPGSSKVPGESPAATVWLDLALVAVADLDGTRTVKAKGDTGALFIDRPTATTLALRGPKLPLGLGGEFLP